MIPLDRILVILGSLALTAVFGCGSEIPGVSPTKQLVKYTLFEGSPGEVWCEGWNVRPGSILTPSIAHSACIDKAGHVTYLPPSTPGAGAVISSMMGPVGDVVNHVVLSAPLQ